MRSKPSEKEYPTSRGEIKGFERILWLISMGIIVVLGVLFEAVFLVEYLSPQLRDYF